MEVKRDPKTNKEHLEFFTIVLSSGWEEILPGIHVKTLAGHLDEAAKRGHVNRIARWEPNAALDVVKVHDFYEEVFVASGSLLVATVDDPARYETFPAYSFACRPPGAKHGPFRAGKEGCVMFETQFYI